VAFTIIIPGIVRLVAVKTPDEVLAVNDAGMVARSLSGRGGLVNRSTAAKLAVFRTPDGDIWPAFRDRLDPLRAAHQAALEAALSDVGPLLQRIAREIASLAATFARGRRIAPRASSSSKRSAVCSLPIMPQARNPTTPRARCRPGCRPGRCARSGSGAAARSRPRLTGSWSFRAATWLVRTPPGLQWPTS
jgi:hypothetical protein